VPRARVRRPTWQRVGLLIPYAWLLLFFLAPFLIVLKISFADRWSRSRPSRRSSTPRARRARAGSRRSTTTASCSATASTCSRT
jgi:ABC-type spermidine/putrescine transport system permease subunit I